jgi:cell wall-associated NlpC family hydrolase
MKSRKLASIVLAGALAGSVPIRAHGNPPETEKSSQADQSLDTIARKYLDTPYNWGGRMTEELPGLDCLGLMFISIRDKYRTPWRSWSVKPSRLMDQIDQKNERKLFLSGPSAVPKEMHPGDFIFLLRHVKLSGDTSVAKDKSGKELYVWHTAIYSGGGKMIHASPFPDERGSETYKVVEEPLVPFLKQNFFEGFIYLRYRGPD